MVTIDPGITTLLFWLMVALGIIFLTIVGMVYGLSMQRRAVKSQGGAIERMEYSIGLQEQALATSRQLAGLLSDLVALQERQNALLERLSAREDPRIP
jgi:hypothetical protein